MELVGRGVQGAGAGRLWQSSYWGTTHQPLSPGPGPGSEAGCECLWPARVPAAWASAASDTSLRLWPLSLWRWSFQAPPHCGVLPMR